MLKQGPPPKNTRTNQSARYIGFFVIAGIVLFVLVLVFQNFLTGIGQALQSVAGYALPQSIISAIFAGLVGLIQAWILREHLESQNVTKFIGFAALGGAVGGLVAGVIMNATQLYLQFLPGVFMGGLAGAIAGAVSSAGQNTFMSSAGRQGQWTTYSLISWSLIWGIGWGISWQIGYLVGTSIGAALMMIASGIALSVFLSNTAIEF